MIFAGYEIEIGELLVIFYDEVLPSGNISQYLYRGTVLGTYPTMGGDTGMRLDNISGDIIYLVDKYVTKIIKADDLLIYI
jgi:hypothetical protein